MRGSRRPRSVAVAGASAGRGARVVFRFFGLAFFVVVACVELLRLRGNAEEFLGEEAPVESPAESLRSRSTNARARTRGDADGKEIKSGDVTVSGGLGSSSEIISSHVTVGYGVNRFIAIETTANYSRRSGDLHTGEQYGPEIALVLRYPNQTMVTPFLGAGPAFQIWKRSYDGETFDRDNGVNAHVFGGLNIRLTRHFGLQGLRRQTRWLTSPPKSYADRVTREPNISFTNAIGFHVVW